MPHAVSKGLGLQALILCGPGSSFPTFTANPDENPKALLPIANRPMVWYPIDFCYRSGITDVTLICPPSAADAIKGALKTNPFLTSIATPAVLAPEGLDQTTGTAAILRLPEVRRLVTADFVVLPCDLVCELGGDKLLQAWMVRAASLPDVLGDEELGCGGFDTTGNVVVDSSSSNVSGPSSGHGSTRNAHSGGLGVWYDTRTGIPKVKSEETDFVATVPLPGSTVSSATSALPSASAAAAAKPSSSSSVLLPHLEQVVTAMPKDSLNDLTEDKESYSVRHGLMRHHRRVRIRTTHRDAHIYVFPLWVMDFVEANEHMDSIGEDVLGWWSKAGWQKGLPKKLGADKVLQKYAKAVRGSSGDEDDGNEDEDDNDNGSNSKTATDKGSSSHVDTPGAGSSPKRPRITHQLSRRVVLPAPTPEGRLIEAVARMVGASNGSEESTDAVDSTPETGRTTSKPEDQEERMPPIVAYVHPSLETAPLIRRVDTSQLLLTVSLQLAKLPSLEEVAAGIVPHTGSGNSSDSNLPPVASAFAHARKVAYPEGVKSRTTITRQDSLVGDSVAVEEKVSIKECVIGANCQIHEGARLHQCLLMEGVVVGKACRLTRCILGKRSEIGAGSVLTDCEVQENMLVEPKTEEKENNFMSSEGLEATAEEMDEAMANANNVEETGLTL